MKENSKNMQKYAEKTVKKVKVSTKIGGSYGNGVGTGTSTPDMVLGVDPGLSGAFVLTDGKTLKTWPMPISVNDRDRQIDFGGVRSLLVSLVGALPPDARGLHVFVERAVPMAMGSKSAFNYGRGFAALEIAIQITGLAVTYVEPQKWAKEMHEGISQDLKPKAKSLIACQRLFPALVGLLPKQPKTGRPLEGPMDALLIAAYGLRKHAPISNIIDLDFF